VSEFNIGNVDASPDLNGENALEMLNFMLKNGIIKEENFTQIRLENEMEKRQKILDKHPYKYREKHKDGYYRTYIPDASRKNGRRQVKKKSLTELEDVIIESVKKGQAVTIDDLFAEFIERKLEIDKLKPSSCGVYRQVYERHYVAEGWSKRDIRKISAEDFTEFLEEQCSKHNLTPRSFGNLKTITKGVIKRAMRRHLIEYTFTTVFDNLDCKAKKRTKSDEEQVFSAEEISSLLRYLTDPANRDVQNLGILFMLLSGCRVGEVVALRFDDFISPTAAVIHATETKYKEDGHYTYAVSSKPKTDASVRSVFIPKEYGWIYTEMRRINPFATYFCTDTTGKRMTTNCLRRRLHRICERLEFKHNKSTHKLRKTFCTIILDHGFDANLITSIMGHTDIRTSEQFYHFDRKSNQMKQEMIDNVVEFRAI